MSDDFFADKFSREPRFVDHRHDQSLLGNIAMEIRIVAVDSVTQFGAGPLLAYHHRRKFNSILSFASVCCRHFLQLLRAWSGKGQFFCHLGQTIFVCELSLLLRFVWISFNAN